MLEAAALYIVAQQCVNHGASVLHEPGVGVPIDAQSGQSGEDLCGGFTGGNILAVAVGGAESAVIVLHFGKAGNGLVDGLFYSRVLLIVGSQRCQCHAGHVGVCLVAGDGPAAVGGLHTQNLVNEGLSCGGSTVGGRVVAAVQCQQCPDRTVVALVLDELQVAEASQQVIAANVGHVAAQRRQGQDHTGVVRRLGLVEPSGFGINVALNILHSFLVVILYAGDGSPRPGQADDHPFAANSADIGGTQFLHVVAGVDVRIADLSKGIQHCKLCLCSSQGFVVVNQQLLQVRQSIVSLPGILNVLFGILGDVADLADLVHDILGLLLILGSGRQLRVGLFRIGQLFQLCDQPLLSRGQVIIGFPGRLDGGAAVLGDVADLLNQLVHSRRLVPVSGGDHGGAAGGGAGSGTAAGLLAVLVAAFLVVVVVSVVQDDVIAVLQVLCRNAHFGMGAVDGVHPAGVFAVVELAQAIDRTDVDGVVGVVVAGRKGDVVLLCHSLEDIPHGFRSIRFHTALACPSGQAAAGQAVGGGSGAVLGVALDGDGDSDFGGYGLDRNGDVGHSRAVAQGYRLATHGVLVIAADGNVTQRHGAGGAVRPGGRQFDAIQVQLLAQVILGLVAAADRQLVADRVRGAAANLLAELVRVLTQRIVGTVVILSPGTALYRGAVLGGALRAEYDGAVHLCGIGIAGIQVLHETDTPIRTAACGVGIGGDIVVPVQAVPVADDGTDILIAADLADKAVGADGANHIVPGLGHKSVTAEDAADTLVAFHGSVHGAGQDGGASAVGGGGVVVAATDDTTGVGAGGFYGAVEGGVADDALSQGVVSGADDAAHIVSTLDRCGAGAVLNGSLEPSGNRANLAFRSGIANHNIALNGAVADGHNEARTGRGVAVASASRYQAGFQGLGAAFQRHVIQDDSAAGQADTRKVIHKACALDLFAVDIQVLDGSTVDAAQQRLLASRNRQFLVVAVNMAREGSVPCANRRPVRGQRNIVCNLEVGPGEGIAVSDHLLNFRQMLCCLDEVGILFRTSAVHGRLTVCEVDFQDVRLRGYRFDGGIFVAGG